MKRNRALEFKRRDVLSAGADELLFTTSVNHRIPRRPKLERVFVELLHQVTDNSLFRGSDANFVPLQFIGPMGDLVNCEKSSGILPGVVESNCLFPPPGVGQILSGYQISTSVQNNQLFGAAALDLDVPHDRYCGMRRCLCSLLNRQ
jgi:hypothetical protein